MKHYKYYNGEKENPFEGKDFGKAFWWKVELYAIEANDKKEDDKLSRTMMDYVHDLCWEGDGQSDTTWDDALKRATKMYVKGIWARSHITTKSFTFAMAEEESNGYYKR